MFPAISMGEIEGCATRAFNESWLPSSVKSASSVAGARVAAAFAWRPLPVTMTRAFGSSMVPRAVMLTLAVPVPGAWPFGKRLSMRDVAGDEVGGERAVRGHERLGPPPVCADPAGSKGCR